MWTQSGMTPLHAAADYDHHECIQLLIVGKADVNIANNSVSGHA